MRLVL